LGLYVPSSETKKNEIAIRRKIRQIRRKIRRFGEPFRNKDDTCAADCFERCWTSDRGHYMLAHSEIGGTNNNNGTEGNWGGLKGDMSKEEASFWRSETEKRCEKTYSVVYRFPALPSPINEDWERMQNLHPLVLHFSKAYRSLETQRKWEESMHELSAAAEEDGVADVPPHYQIQSLRSSCQEMHATAPAAH
jgi:hypothetical protein